MKLDTMPVLGVFSSIFVFSNAPCALSIGKLRGSFSDEPLQQSMSSLRQKMWTMMEDDGTDGADDGDAASSDTSILRRAPEVSEGRHSETAPVEDPEPQALYAEEENETAEEDLGRPPEDPIYANADSAAEYAESQKGVEFLPEGSSSDLDVPPSERRALTKAFEERPDLFGSCTLIRDFAEPLRVGSAILGQLGSSEAEDPPDSDNSSILVAPNQTKAVVPDDMLRVEGGISDRSAGSDGEALPEISMFAFLRSVAGEVAVVPNGAVARWSSKKKVPIAGYLCTEDGRKVLYTLPTPCLATTMGDDGMPRPPGTTTAAPGASPAAAPGPAVAPDGEQPAAAPGSTDTYYENASFLELGSRLDPDKADNVTEEDFYVFVGARKLHFSSKRKAEHFCEGLAESIADDMGDHEFDPDTVETQHAETDANGTMFAQLARKAPSADWTFGKKSLLVVVMDWKYGDNSRRPYSKQTQSVAHYRDKIFPRVRQAFRKMSYGKFDIVPTFVPDVVRYVESRSRYTRQGYPFPGLYLGARDAIDSNSRYRRSYNFDNFDLVYVIAPQQAPVGTKGVAWVGAKGAICNGCEAISDNFQVMVAVHELGHNLGLSHASSRSLEYGNPFDWMGNYPDVTGLSYGAGYKRKLGWLPGGSIARITDRQVAGLKDRYIIKPFDIDRPPQSPELAAVQISLSDNPRDLYIAYRETAGQEAGVYIVMQDKGSPDSELIDLGCHTSSQKDARLRPGWTYLDPSNQVVVYLESVSKDSASLLLFSVSQSNVGAIRARDDFSDGRYKCPRTCTDSDLLVAQFGSCADLAAQGYCSGGSITMDGRKMAIGVDLCPQSCGNCDQVLAGPTTFGSSGGSGCSDRNIKIGGRTCFQARLAGYCDRNTNLGHVGKDLCPKSCGECPPVPRSSGASSSSVNNPRPVRTHGVATGKETESVMPAPETPTEEPSSEAPEPAAESQDDGCKDDATWTDKEGDGCAVYEKFIDDGKLTQQQACDYGDGSARQSCKKTCGECGADASTTTTTEAPTTTTDTTTSDLPCEDSECVESWKASFGQCFKCEEFADTYCGQDALFMQSCRKTCKLCTPAAPPPCADDFEQSQCEQWSGLGFCDQPKIQRSCKMTCGACGPSAAAITGQNMTLEGQEAQLEDAHWDWGSRHHVAKAATRQLKRLEERVKSSSWRGIPATKLAAAMAVMTILWSV